jgi:hypothetical protein
MNNFRVVCSRCTLSQSFASEKEAKLAGWWYDSRRGWLCPTHNAEYDVQTELPFSVRALTESDKDDFERHWDTKRYEQYTKDFGDE